VLLYTDALKHYADFRQRFFTDWFQGAPPGGKVTPSPQDEVTARMDLLAPAAVRNAWRDLVAAERAFDTWIAVGSSGDPDESAPGEVIEPLEVAMEKLRTACQLAVGNSDG